MIQKTWSCKLTFHRENCKKLYPLLTICAMVKRDVCKLHHLRLDKYVIFIFSDTENDVHGNQYNAYKIIKHLNKSERDTENL